LEISPAWTGVPAKAQETIPSSANASSFFIVFKVNWLRMLSGKDITQGKESVQHFFEPLIINGAGESAKNF
jgi:hypothetical protein